MPDPNGSERLVEDVEFLPELAVDRTTLDCGIGLQPYVLAPEDAKRRQGCRGRYTFPISGLPGLDRDA